MFKDTISHRISEFFGVAFFAIALTWFIALASFDPSDSVWFFNTGDQVPPANFVGKVGALLAEASYQVFGFTSYLVPIWLIAFGWNYFWCKPIDSIYTKLVGLALMFGCSASLLSLSFDTLEFSGKTLRAGGYLGEWLSELLAAYLNYTGSVIAILTLLFLSVILSTQFSFSRLFESLGNHITRWASTCLSALKKWKARNQRERERQQVIRKHLDNQNQESLEFNSFDALNNKKKVRPLNKAPEGINKTIKTIRPEKNTPRLPLQDPANKNKGIKQKNTFTLPPTALLDSPKAVHKFDERILMSNARLLEEKCKEFAVEGSVVQIHPGPIVTTFEFKPDAGIKYSKITSLADDLSLAMQAESVLIDRIPGKSTVGIQIPNPARDEISLRELLESENYQQSSSKLSLALGKTIHGEPFVTDLTKMPHLLIAGATGTGKSVALNAMLSSILYRATPDDVRLILIDPKRLELGMYEDIPHLLAPVVVDPKQASNALRWAVREMEDRYKRLAAEGVRNIEQYNRNIEMSLQEQLKDTTKKTSSDETLKLLPFIVLAIDELADLMMVASSEVEESIARLAQMARAVGIHLILATQRPSVDVITGLIKANFPARIAFRVSSKVDSRTILDSNGAEQLLGKGDMLYLPPSSSRSLRLHGSYISEQESGRLASFLRKQGKPDYNKTVTEEEKPPDSIEFERDDIYDQAARIVVSSGQASISYLQRRLRIGFSRAARLIDMMEADGLVTSQSSGKTREVLVKQDYFEEIDLQLR